MTQQQKIAVEELAILIVQNKRGIIKLVNEQKLGSLTYDAPLSEVNKIVLDNLTNERFVKGLEKVVGDDFKYEPLSTATIIIISVIAASTVYKVGWDAYNARQMRKQLLREERRTLYLKEEEMDEIALLNRKNMQNMILHTQQGYLQEKENLDAMQQEQKKKNVLLMVIASMVCVAIITRQLLK